MNELTRARQNLRGLLLSTMIFTIFVNFLMLTGPLYMLQVYDRVLGSRSEATLVALSCLVVFLYVVMSILENARSQVMAIVGARFQDQLDRRVFSAAMQRSALAPNDPIAISAQRDLEGIRTFLASPTLLAIMDLPWTPLFLAAIFVFHPMLGWLSVCGGVVLLLVTILSQVCSRGPAKDATVAAAVSERLAEQLKAEAETLQALGMSEAGYDRWQSARHESLFKGIAAAATAGYFSSITRSFRLFLQSAMLGLGAWLVLRGELSSGAMIAGSILMGRALAPIEIVVSQWVVPLRAYDAWYRLSELLLRVPDRQVQTMLPRPRAFLEVEALTVSPPGERIPQLKGVSFRLDPGQALGVIGPSGAGKSTLAKAVTGVWQPLAGKVRLDGASLDQYGPERLGHLVGYLPQRVTLFDGTIADNIARLGSAPDSKHVIAAAQKADAHEMIIRLPKGYDTHVSSAGCRLSGGQLQRIGLARALYGDPVLLILDEPNSNLDSSGSQALNTAIRTFKSEGKLVLVMAHRPAALQECNLVLVLEDGQRKALGPRDQVLRDQVKNHTEILKPLSPGAVS